MVAVDGSSTLVFGSGADGGSSQSSAASALSDFETADLKHSAAAASSEESQSEYEESTMDEDDDEYEGGATGGADDEEELMPIISGQSGMSDEDDGFQRIGDPLATNSRTSSLVTIRDGKINRVRTQPVTTTPRRG